MTSRTIYLRRMNNGSVQDLMNFTHFDNHLKKVGECNDRNAKMIKQGRKHYSECKSSRPLYFHVKEKFIQEYIWDIIYYNL